MTKYQSKIEKLISELCPNGVEFKTLGELGYFYGGLTGKSKEDFSGGHAKFVTYMNIASNITIDTNINTFVKLGEGENQNEVEYGDVLFTGSSETPNEVGLSSVLIEKLDEPLYLNSFCFGFRLNDKNIFLPEFLKYVFRDEQTRKQIIKTASGVTRFNVSKKRFATIKIPIPPLAIQEEIVNILNSFTELEAELEVELEAELEARKKQYEHYRNKLIFSNKTFEQVYLGDIAEISTGSHNTKDAVAYGGYVFYARGREPLRLDSFDFDEKAIITAGDGVGVGKVFHFADGKYALHQRAYRIVPNKNIDPRFIYHYLVTDFDRYLEQTSVHASVTSLRRPMFLKYQISLPPLDEQRRISSILDKFESLINDISIGLPAELKARRSQHEYYREKLLTFNEYVS